MELVLALATVRANTTFKGRSWYSLLDAPTLASTRSKATARLLLASSISGCSVVLALATCASNSTFLFSKYRDLFFSQSFLRLRVFIRVEFLESLLALGDSSLAANTPDDEDGSCPSV
eukprot:CAMPEP_0181351582 /NCGR_PEP_ID=MMETSP1106-20121128/1865_1 /TAXON_ID=81844 /ORGANISM="Mantoniella antarctica, Strain SL-175" /LENGTH=117 /DNA_ID=CAMNT_0023464109 /DNA_START=1653 /DNA_END=2007 /DNA_ORIENTATION=+